MPEFNNQLSKFLKSYPLAFMDWYVHPMGWGVRTGFLKKVALKLGFGGWVGV